jgi:hypothetical protein
METHLAADRGHAEGIAVAANAGDDAADQRSPNDSALRQAIGRAPMVKTSRKMPPTPVVAP